LRHVDAAPLIAWDFTGVCTVADSIYHLRFGLPRRTLLVYTVLPWTWHKHSRVYYTPTRRSTNAATNPPWRVLPTAYSSRQLFLTHHANSGLPVLGRPSQDQRSTAPSLHSYSRIVAPAPFPQRALRVCIDRVVRRGSMLPYAGATLSRVAALRNTRAAGSWRRNGRVVKPKDCGASPPVPIHGKP